MKKNRTSQDKEDDPSEHSDSQESSDNSQDDQQYASDKEEDDELLGVEPNEEMLAWADCFKDQHKLAQLAETIWNQYNPEKKGKITQDEANKARVALNKEIQKHVKEAHSAIEEENPEKFPIILSSMFFIKPEIEKAEFLKSAQGLKDLVELLEILGKRLMPAIYDVYNEKYQDKEGKWVAEEIYLEFFDDVAEKMGSERNEMFDEIDESMECVEFKNDKRLFSLRDCIVVALDNFRRLNDEQLYKSNLLSRYEI